MAELDPVVGSEQGGCRPVLIIQNDMGNLHAPTVIAVPLTGSTNKPALPTHVRVARGEGGLWRESTVLCEQVRTLEKPACCAIWEHCRPKPCGRWSGRFSYRWIWRANATQNKEGAAGGRWMEFWRFRRRHEQQRSTL